MVDRKEVTLDGAVAKYLPENVKLPERSGKSVTLHDLSTHTSGFPPIPSNRWKDSGLTEGIPMVHNSILVIE